MASGKTVPSNERWKAENTEIYRIRVTKSSGIVAAMKKMNLETGISQTVYLRQALVAQLRKDGYMPEPKE